MLQRFATVLFLAGAMLALTGCPTQEQLHPTPTKSGERETVYGQALDRADKSACEQYVAQLNQAAQMYRTTNEQFPPDLATVIKESGLPQSELANCKFNYDPATGRVTLAK